MIQKTIPKENVVLLGRDSSCDISIADDSISRYHAELMLTKDHQLFVTDRDSRNGTFLVDDQGQSKKIRQGRIGSCVSVRFGSCHIALSDLLHLVIDCVRRREKSVATTSPEVPASDDSKPWIRCSCGQIKREKTRCSICQAT